MTAFAALSLHDGTAARTFDPSSLINGLAAWRFATGVFDANPQVTMSVSLPNSSGKVSRVKARVIVPVMDTVDTSIKLGDITVNVEIVAPKASTLAQRTMARSLLNELVENASFIAANDGLQGIY